MLMLQTQRGAKKKAEIWGKKTREGGGEGEYFEVLQSAHAADSFKLEPAV